MIGQWRLMDVCGAQRGDRDTPWLMRSVVCRVTNWNQGGGFGSLEAEIKDHALLDRPAFVHASAFGGGNLWVGQIVRAELVINKMYPKGPYLAAQKVVFLSQGSLTWDMPGAGAGVGNQSGEEQRADWS